jgi:hypothetical protein
MSFWQEQGHLSQHVTFDGVRSHVRRTIKKAKANASASGPAAAAAVKPEAKTPKKKGGKK